MRLRGQTSPSGAHARRSLHGALACTFAFCMLAACGQTGPLELPQDAAEPASGASSGAPAASEEEAAEARRSRQDER